MCRKRLENGGQKQQWKPIGSCWRQRRGRRLAGVEITRTRGKEIDETPVFGVFGFLAVEPVMEIWGNGCGGVREEQESKES
jgi:hypothetical protein